MPECEATAASSPIIPVYRSPILPVCTLIAQCSLLHAPSSRRSTCMAFGRLQ